MNRNIEVNIFLKKYFSEKVYSSLRSLKDPHISPSIDIHKDECSEFLRSSKLCDSDNCYNKSFAKRLEKLNSKERGVC